MVRGAAAKFSSEPVARALRGCEGPDEASRCQAWCMSEWLETCSGTSGVIKGMSTWDPDADDIATAVTDEQGCALARLRAPGVSYRGQVFGPGHLPQIGHFVAASSVPSSSTFNALVSAGVRYSGTVIERSPDLRNG